MAGAGAAAQIEIRNRNIIPSQTEDRAARTSRKDRLASTSATSSSRLGNPLESIATDFAGGVVHRMDHSAGEVCCKNNYLRIKPSSGTPAWTGSIVAPGRNLRSADLKTLCGAWTKVLRRESVKRLHLEELDLSKNPVTAGAPFVSIPILQLCNWLRQHHVTVDVIKLFHCELPDEAIFPVAQYMDWCASEYYHPIQELHLSDNAMGQAGFRSILEVVVKNGCFPADDQTRAARAALSREPRRGKVR